MNSDVKEVAATGPGCEEIAGELERCRESFEYWAEHCATIKDKRSGRLVPFCLNGPQRKLLAAMEGQRRAGQPVRIILLKARQWGGSTLVQLYMAWIQCVHRRNWNSVICAQVGKTSAVIRGMYERMLAHYPEGLWQGDEKHTRPALLRYQGQDLIREIAGRGCTVTLGSSESQDSIRGADFAMAHLSEVAFWKDTAKSRPADFVRAICGSVALEPYTLVVMESTANGVGNYFHTEWLRAERGESAYRAVFVPWYEIEIYRKAVADAEAELAALTDYERRIMDTYGLTIEQMAWYHHKCREYPTHAQMMAEYPTTAEEAFINTGNNVFSSEAVGRLRQQCCDPLAVGDLRSDSGAIVGPASIERLKFTPDSRGAMEVWEFPEKDVDYVVAVDVGGRTALADWSVIAVVALNPVRVVAQWRGHTDHDILTWHAAAVATWYGEALLVFESNTLESASPGTAEQPETPSQGAYILNELYAHYPNLYHRFNPETGTSRPGFHTNRATKQMIITELIGAVRDGALIERSAACAAEFAIYEQRPNGSYAARSGGHDDMLMTRAIAYHVARQQG